MEWISVKDRMPDDKKTVIVYADNRIYPAFYNTDKDHWLAWSGWKMDLNFFLPTHWMPLPECPANKP